MDKYLIGIDAGTTNVKAVIYDLLGNEIALSTIDNKVYMDGVLSEQDMNELWNNVLICLKDLIKSNNIDASKIMGIGVTGQGEGLWAIDKDGEPIGNSILWNDSRALELVNQIKEDESFYREIKKVVASYIRPGSTLTLIKWLKENRPNDYERAKVIFTCKDWIRYKLTGEIYWELSDATCSCVDLDRKIYASSIFKRLGIKDVVEKLPSLISGIDNAGYLKKDVAKEIGLREGIPISGGMIDIVSTAAGVGAIKENDICIILGTTGMTFSVLPKYVWDYNYNGWETHIDGMSYIKGMGTMAATPNLDWAIRLLFSEESESEIYEEITENLSKFGPFESGLVYHPHISNSGERAPFFNPKATAQFLGIQSNTTKYDMVHAIMEGVALSIKDCLIDIKNINKIYLSGGGAKSPIWAQIISDVLDKEILISDSKELAAKGAALSAGIMIGLIEDMDNIDKHFSKIKTIMKPNKEYVKIYEELYETYKKTQYQMNEFWNWRFKKVSKF